MKQYAISTWIVEELDAEDAISLLTAAGFREAEISGGASPLLMAWEADPIATTRRLEAAGIAVRSIHCPRAGRHIDVEDDAARQASVAANVDYFRRMKACGVPEIVIHPTSSIDVSTEAQRDAARTRSRDSLERLAAHGAAIGVRMAVENLGREGRPGCCMADLIAMIDDLGPHVGLCLDVGHSGLAGLDIVHELTLALSTGKLFSLHIHDVNDDGRDHFMPGEGRLDFDTFVATLDSAGFDGVRTLEVKPPETDVAGRLAEAARVRDAWAAR